MLNAYRIIMRKKGGPFWLSRRSQFLIMATVLAKITYCLPAWSGLCTAADRTRLNSFLRRCVKLGYYSSNDPPTISSIADDVEDTLFKSILRNAQHVLPPYPEERPCHVDRRRALIGGAV